jgi:hypothetical protein
MSFSDSDCRCVVLASGAAGQVTTCPECGTIHVSMPQMSLRLTRDTFHGLASLVVRASIALDDAKPQARPECAADRALH